MELVRENQHIPVMLKEAVALLCQNKGNVYVDCTLGGGGHTAAILSTLKQAKVIAFDRDGAMIEKAKTRFREEISAGRLVLVHANYSEIRQRLNELGFTAVDGVLVDAGVSSFQLDDPERGFSFIRKGPLDMRMDQSAPVSAYNVVNEWPKEDLENAFFRYGEERFSRKIAARIVERRMEAPIADTETLARIIEDCLPRSKGGSSVHPATRVFQAIRIVVNGELEGLEALLGEIPDILRPGGTFAAISFHSLEDRLVKERLRFLSANCVCPPHILTCERCNKPPGVLYQRKPMVASDEEIRMNPRSRSAKLRVFIKNPA